MNVIMHVTINSFLQRLPQIQVNEDGEPIRETVEINRNNVLGSIFTKKQEYGDELFDTDIYIKFTDEDGIDQGGLKREFFTLLW